MASHTHESSLLVALLVSAACGGTETGTGVGSTTSGGAAGSGAATTGGSGGATGGASAAGGAAGRAATGGSPGSCAGAVCGRGTSCCGPSECGRCVPDTSGVFCPDYCDFCDGKYQRYSHTTLCPSGGQWEIVTMPLSPFQVPECQDLATNLPRYCCTDEFRPVCP